MCAKRILVADDVEQNVVLLASLVRSLGYEVEMARDGLEALAKALLDVDLVLLDVTMPGLDGYEVARRLRAEPRLRDLPVIMVTMLDSRDDRRRAIQAGASDFIAKPVERTELALRIASQLRFKEAREALDRSQQAHLDAIRRLVLAAELKAGGTVRHMQRLGRSCSILAGALRLPPNETEILCHAVTMHDVGNIGIPDLILFKPGRLSSAERRVMETHTLIGGRILANSSSELLRAGQIVAMTHHERWDGTGYPQGLAGHRIPLWGRICAMVDVFDALTTPRPYREPLHVEAALALMIEGRSSRFDPDLLDRFAERRDELFALYEDAASTAPPADPAMLATAGDSP